MDYISDSLTNIDPKILKQLKTPNKLFSFRTISLFNNLVAATTDFDMISINFYHYPELCPVHDETKNDVQILSTEPKNQEPGHLRCIFYNAGNKTVSVYDSQYQKNRPFELSEKEIFIIKRRYPNHTNINYIDTKTKQIDRSSCGPFSIAFATSLILGQDPKTHKLKTIPIFSASFFSKKFDHSETFRKHILKMFQSKKLLPFPR